MNFVTVLLLGLALCNGAIARDVNGAYGGNGTINSKDSYTTNILTAHWDAARYY